MSYKFLWKGFLGSFIFGIISAFVWFCFSFFGTYGFWSAPAFALLIPLGFKLFSKKRPTETPSFIVMGSVLLITTLLGAYAGYIINIYAMFLNYGYSIDSITLSGASRYLFDMFSDNPSGFRLDVILEIGAGLILSAVIGIFVIKNQIKKDTEEAK
jgi:hypothetical protein